MFIDFHWCFIDFHLLFIDVYWFIIVCYWLSLVVYWFSLVFIDFQWFSWPGWLVFWAAVGCGARWTFSSVAPRMCKSNTIRVFLLVACLFSYWLHCFFIGLSLYVHWFSLVFHCVSLIFIRCSLIFNGVSLIFVGFFIDVYWFIIVCYWFFTGFSFSCWLPVCFLTGRIGFS